jgi:NAD(P)-dependent dehydrogenase (short-subunit alcohol dehydrogenase family)
MRATTTATRTVIITGGNTGLGEQCARTIAADHSWHIVIASRDAARAEVAVARLIDATGNPAIEALPLDLASLASVRTFATAYAERSRPSLCALVCNAGIQIARDITYTVDGFETMFGVNHLGHFLFTHLMLRQLTAPARIIVVSSGTHDPNSIDGRFNAPIYRDAAALAWPARAGAPQMSGIRRYATSKLCNLFFAYELDRRLRECRLSTPPRPITVNAYDPGATPGTGLVRQYPALVRALWASPLTARALRVLGLRVYDVATSGAAMARLVLAPELEGVSRRYIHVHNEAASSQESHDQHKARELWDASVAMVGLEAHETLFPLSERVPA